MMAIEATKPPGAGSATLAHVALGSRCGHRQMSPFAPSYPTVVPTYTDGMASSAARASAATAVAPGTLPGASQLVGC